MSYRDKIRGIFHINDTPHRIAIAFSVGVFMGISPLLGLHTIGAFFIAWLFGLNRLVAIVGVYITNPWTIVPIYSFCLWVGVKLTGLNQVLPDVDWKNLKIMQMLSELTHLLLPFVVGSIVVGIISSVASYFIVYSLILRYRRGAKDDS